jgi:hypothetical protein
MKNYEIFLFLCIFSVAYSGLYVVKIHHANLIVEKCSSRQHEMLRL